MSAATTQAYIGAPLSNECIPTSVAFSGYDSKDILSGFKALLFRVESCDPYLVASVIRVHLSLLTLKLLNRMVSVELNCLRIIH